MGQEIMRKSEYQMGEQRGETFLKSGVSNYFQCDADLSGFLLIRTKSGGSRCFAEDYFDSSCRKWQVLLGGRCFWDLLRQLVTELGQSDPWTVRVPTFWPPSAAVGGKVGRDGIIWAILLVFAVVCFVHWSACLRVIGHWPGFGPKLLGELFLV